MLAGPGALPVSMRCRVLGVSRATAICDETVRRRLVSLVFVAVGSLLFACASLHEPPPDLEALASEHGLPLADLALFFEGYQEGYDDGEDRNAGTFAGTGHSNVPGLEGDGWVLGHADSRNGRPRRDAAEVAACLAEDRRE